MIYQKMFVVYIQGINKKERLYFKAYNTLEVVAFIMNEINCEILQIKKLKRIYKKTDIFIEV